VIRELLDVALGVYYYAVFGWVILSWIPMSPGHPLGRIQNFLDRIILPVIRPIREVIPPIRIGGGALDLSAIILLVAIYFLRILV